MKIETLHLTFKDDNRTVSAAIPAYMDVLGVYSDNTVHITATVPAASIDESVLFKAPGLYKLKIAVGSDECVDHVGELEFKWNGDWNSAELNLIKQYPWPSLKKEGDA